MQPVVFSAGWFDRYQSVLLGLLRVPVIGHELRDVLAIRRHDVGYDGRIVALTPHSYTVANPDGTFTTDFRTHAKYAKRLRHQLDGLWRAAHAWDQYVANPFVPALNVGFDTLTKSPDPDPETTSVDGVAIRDAGDEAWSSLIGGAGSFSSDTVTSDAFVQFYGGVTSNTYKTLYRSFFLFDTSALTAAAVISSATISLYGANKVDGLSCAPTIDIYAATPASNTAIAGSDFVNVGATSYTGSPITYAGWSTTGYNAFALNATGLAAISKTGVSKVSARNANYDVAAVAPAWVASGQSFLNGYYADQLGGSNDPKIDVTYTVPNFLLVTLLGTTP